MHGQVHGIPKLDLRDNVALPAGNEDLAAAELAVEFCELVRRSDAASRGRLPAVAGVGPFRLMRAASWFRDGMRGADGGRSGLDVEEGASAEGGAGGAGRGGEADMVVGVVGQADGAARAYSMRAKIASGDCITAFDCSLRSPFSRSLET